MSDSDCRSSTTTSDRPSFALVGALCLTALLGLVPGCGGSSADQPQVVVPQEDPVGEFEWAMERLDRALRHFRPSSGDGLNTQRTMEHELISPNDQTPHYTARVTVTTEMAFLHGKRRTSKADKNAKQPEASKIDDPLADPSDELNKVVDIAGTGPQAPVTASTSVEPRTIDNKSVFDLAYIDGRWKLTQQPEAKYEQLWFEYAFE